MMVYSINSKESFSHIITWIKEVKLKSHPDIKIFLIGNKSDLEEDRQVKREEGEAFSKDNGISFFEETSAKTGKNAKEVFVKVAKLLYKDHLKYKKRGCDISLSDDNSLTSNNTSNDSNKKIKIMQKRNNRNNSCC